MPNKRMNEWTNDQTNERTNKRTNAWTNEWTNEWMNELYQQSLCLSDQKAKAQGQNVIQSEKQFWSMSIRSVDMGLHFVSDECSSCSTSENVILSFLSHHLKNRPISIRNPENIVQCARKGNIAPQDWKIEKACCSEQNSSVRNLPASWYDWALCSG